VTPATVFEPTPEQRDAITHPMTPLLLVAGAGTGKTSVMAERILYLVEGGVPGDQVLGLTFTNKAAAALKVKVRERLGHDAGVTVGTYHSFSAGLVIDHLLELDLHPRTRLLNRAQAWQLLFAVFDEFRFNKRRTFRPELVVADGLLLASRCADHLVDVEAVVADCDDLIEHAKWAKVKDTAVGRRELCQVVAAYEQRKRERRLIDHGDQIRLAVRVLREQPDVAAALRRQHPVVLLDEYQDTNYAQRVLLQAIYPEGSAITAVGDDMQSIYAFRGAHLENLLQFRDHFPPVVVLPLSVNRRSGPEIVELANRIHGQVRRTLPRTLAPLDGAPPSTIECFVAADDVEEANTIASDIAALGAPWSDHAVLCRKRRQLIPVVVNALEERGIPVDVVGSSGLLDRPEIVDLVSWLEVLADPGAVIALLRLLQGPRYRIGMRDLAALARFARAADVEMQLADAVAEADRVPDLSDEARSRLERFRDEWRDLVAVAKRLAVVDLAETIIDRTGLWAAAGDRGGENLLRFLDLAAEFEPVDGDPGLVAFVEYIHLLDESEEDLAEAYTSGRDAVRVMTIHQAKGLEFPNVWIPGLAGSSGRWGIFPDSRGGENPVGQQAALPWWVRTDRAGMPDWRSVGALKEIDDEVRRRSREEEWRLFYVACTRAQHRLVCSTAQWYPGPSQPQGPSPFYDFIAQQSDLVKERFRHDPSELDPAVAAMRRRMAGVTAAQPAPAAPATVFGAIEPPEPRRAPPSLSVTSLVSYARCPRQFYWTAVRPLPRPTSLAARIGSDVHRWIERRSDKQLNLFEDDDMAYAGRSESLGVISRLRDSFLATPYASLDPEAVEAAFELVIGGRLIRGRIDAVYRRDGRTELVDFKTGHPPVEGDGGAETQLDLYALGAVATWATDPNLLRTTYCYLSSDAPPSLVSADWDADRYAATLARLEQQLAGVEAGDFAVRVGQWCGTCDFLPFCSAGQQVRIL
jgi:DNA helicase II / ATP-dependent DNA helicase PcrA